MKYILVLLYLATPCFAVVAQKSQEPTSQDSLKGSIGKERAWWNVLRYELTIELDWEQEFLQGKNNIEFEVLHNPHSGAMQIDLQPPLSIDSVLINNQSTTFSREGAAWFVSVPPLANENHILTVFYSGNPKASTNPPWDGGVVWSSDSLGRPWISVACQMVGASVWFPCKDHYSEEPELGMSLTIRAPSGLQAVGNGRLIKSETTGQKTHYTWNVINPINNYGIAFYIGNYIKLEDSYQGESGNLDMTYWVLDYHQDQAKSYLIPETTRTMAALEYWFGPYPFYEDGFQMVESSYIGMEHQSAIAYGNKFSKGRSGFNNLSELDLLTDRLIVHEMAHEWFGNSITMSDLADRWVQEGFAALAEELVVEYHFGKDTATAFYLTRRKGKIKNRQPMISNYGIWQDAGGDMYFKGWAVLNMLRRIINDDEKFRSLLRAMNSGFRHQTIYSQDLEEFIAQFLSVDLEGFFDQYLRTPGYPVLETREVDSLLEIRLSSEIKDLAMPLDIISPVQQRIMVNTNWQELNLPGNAQADSLDIDPFYLVERK